MSAVIKQDRATQRLYVLAEVGSGAADLTSKILEVKLALPDSSNPQTISGTIILPQTGADLGRFYTDVTTANLTAVANPAQVLLVWNIYNADMSLFLWGQGLFDVVL